MSLSNILESNNPVTPQPWTLLHAQRYKGLSLDVGKLENVVTVNGDPISEYKLQIDNSAGPGSELLTEIAPRNYQIKTLQAGSGITLTDNPTNVEIASSVNSYSLAAARFGIDPSSNPGPVIGGLLFDPTLTTGGNFALPMISTSAGLGIGDNYLDDTDNYFTLISPTELQINVSGKYSLSTNWFVLSNDTLTTCVIQVLRNSDLMFTAPPATSSATNLVPAGTAPISALYSNMYSFQAAIDANLTAGDIIGVKLYCEGGSGGDTAEISLTSALCIHLIGGTSSGAGSGVNAVNSLGTGESLLNPSGAVPIIGVKSLVAGTGVTLTPTPNDLTVTSVAANGYVAYQSAVPDPAPNGVAPTNVWLPVQTLTVSGTILPSSKLVIAYDGWWINPDPAATVTGQFIIYVTSPSAVVTTSQLTISVLRQSLPTVTDFMATQSQNYVMPITQLGNYTIEVRGSTALSATASGLWNFYAYVTN